MSYTYKTFKSQSYVDYKPIEIVVLTFLRPSWIMEKALAGIMGSKTKTYMCFPFSEMNY